MHLRLWACGWRTPELSQELLQSRENPDALCKLRVERETENQNQSIAGDELCL